MPLLIKCPLSNYQYMLEGFGQEHKKITSYHPLLSCKIQQLELITDYRNQDSFILLTAWLNQLASMQVIEWNSPLDPNEFSPRWIDQELPRVRKFALWCSSNSDHPALSTSYGEQLIPRLRLSFQLTTENLQLWLNQCETILASYTTIFDSMEAVRAKIANDRLLERMDSQDSPARRKYRNRLDYMTRSFSSLSRELDSAHVIKVVTSPQLYQVASLQDAKRYCLDFLLEHNNLDYNDKQEIIQILDIAILDRIGIAAVMNGETGTEHRALELELQTKYSLQVADQIYTTTPNQKLAASIHKSLAREIGASSTSIAPAPHWELEPQKDQFSNPMLYLVAHRQWSKQV